MDFIKLHEHILALESKIRFATIFDTNGRIIQSGHREGLTSMLTKAESKKSTNEILKSHKAHVDLSSKYGKEKYSIGVYEKIIRVIIPLDKKNILYVTMDVDIDPFSVMTKITKLAQKSMV